MMMECPLWVISRHNRPVRVMSALPPKADIRQRIEHVCFVPIADVTSAAPRKLPELVRPHGSARFKCLRLLRSHGS
jgi:hypothetical protein